MSVAWSKPFREGYAAYLHGESDSPYPESSIEHKEWTAGWWSSYRADQEI